MIVARIQGHPSRRHLHDALADALGVPVDVVLHESDPPSPWAGYQACLRDIPDCSHLLIIQDDARVARGIATALEKVASEVPTALFLARLPRDVSAKATLALKKGHRYVTWVPRSFVPVVAILWPREKAVAFKEWADTSPRTSGPVQHRSDDAMVGLWGALTKQEFRATVPSLVEHPDREPSLIGRKNMWGKDKGRVAQHFCEDALQYEW